MSHALKTQLYSFFVTNENMGLCLYIYAMVGIDVDSGNRRSDNWQSGKWRSAQNQDFGIWQHFWYPLGEEGQGVTMH